MKKSKSWIHVCVRFLLFITFGVHSATLEVNAVTDDTHTYLPSLRQNIPKDYKIPVTYIPKEVAGMCWVKLNVVKLEESLENLSHKFGNISSNKYQIEIVIVYLQDEQMKMNDQQLENHMYDFECHYRKEKWETERYFDFVKELCGATHQEDYSYECDPPPCPTTPAPVPSELLTPSELPLHNSTNTKCPMDCPSSLDTRQEDSPADTTKLILLSLLFFSLLAFVLLLCVVWKVRSRRNREGHRQNRPEEEFFTEREGMAPPLNAATPEKILLNVIETV